jgi:hypothetical protein
MFLTLNFIRTMLLWISETYNFSFISYNRENDFLCKNTCSSAGIQFFNDKKTSESQENILPEKYEIIDLIAGLYANG